jgi:hypothetical protein
MKMDKVFVDSEERLNKALRDFEAASQAFLKCRAFYNKTLVETSCRRLLEASDDHAALKRALIDD